MHSIEGSSRHDLNVRCRTFTTSRHITAGKLKPATLEDATSEPLLCSPVSPMSSTVNLETIGAGASVTATTCKKNTRNTVSLFGGREWLGVT